MIRILKVQIKISARASTEFRRDVGPTLQGFRLAFDCCFIIGIKDVCTINTQKKYIILEHAERFLHNITQLLSRYLQYVHFVW